jgi:hypothetical protein
VIVGAGHVEEIVNAGRREGKRARRLIVLRVGFMYSQPVPSHYFFFAFAGLLNLCGRGGGCGFCFG